MNRLFIFTLLLLCYTASYSQPYSVTFIGAFKNNDDIIKLSDSLHLPILINSDKVYAMSSACFPIEKTAKKYDNIRESGSDENVIVDKSKIVSARESGSDENVIVDKSKIVNARESGSDENVNIKKTTARESGSDENVSIKKTTARESGGDENVNIKKTTARESGSDENQFTCMVNSKNEIVIKFPNKPSKKDVSVVYKGIVYKAEDGIFRVK